MAKYLDKSKINPAPTAPPKTPKIQLRDYQSEAIKTWLIMIVVERLNMPLEAEKLLQHLMQCLSYKKTNAFV